LKIAEDKLEEMVSEKDKEFILMRKKHKKFVGKMIESNKKFREQQK